MDCDCQFKLAWRTGAYALVLVNQVALVEQHAKAIEESSTLSDLKVAVQEENQIIMNII